MSHLVAGTSEVQCLMQLPETQIYVVSISWQDERCRMSQVVTGIRVVIFLSNYRDWRFRMPNILAGMRYVQRLKYLQGSELNSVSSSCWDAR